MDAIKLIGMVTLIVGTLLGAHFFDPTAGENSAIRSS
jgi:hypothetical protein